MTQFSGLNYIENIFPFGNFFASLKINYYILWFFKNIKKKLIVKIENGLKNTKLFECYVFWVH